EISLKISKTEGIPIRLVNSDNTNANVVGSKRVAELDFYCFSPSELATKVNLTMPRCSALIWYLDLKNSSEFYKEIVFTENDKKQRYSHKALRKLTNELKHLDLAQVWQEYRHDTNYGKLKPLYLRNSNNKIS
ncbi:MAG: hypothetical protein AAFV93_17840, partial [Chloroflexota bacterium]